MDLPDSRSTYPGEIFYRREAVIDGVNVDIVHIQQNATVGFFGDRRKKYPFRHGRNRIGQIAGYILYQNPASEPVLNVTDSRGDMTHRFFGVRKRPEIVCIATVERS